MALISDFFSSDDTNRLLGTDRSIKITDFVDGYLEQGVSKKQCYNCKARKPYENFYADSSRPFPHLSSWCIECASKGKRTVRVNSHIEQTQENSSDVVVLSSNKKSTRSAYVPSDAEKKLDSQGIRTCRDCGEEKPHKEFPLKRGKINGWVCKLCNNARDHRGRHEQKEWAAFRKKRASALRAGKVFTLEFKTWKPIMQEITHCPDCGSEAEWYKDRTKEGITNSGYRSDVFSFDQTIAGDGYTDENARCICSRCNSQKGKLTTGEWLAVLQYRINTGMIKEIDPRLLLLHGEKEEQLNLNFAY